MTEYREGGRRRIDRVLNPDFLTDLTTMPIDELREKRLDADQEEVDLSYDRRLLHGRMDVLKAEQERREGRGPLVGRDESDEALVNALSKILSDGQRSVHGLGRHLTAEPSRVGEHRREAERAVSDLSTSSPSDMSDDELTEAIGRLADIEQRVSRSRRQVQGVCDLITAEIARRYQESGSPVDAVAHDAGSR